MKVISRQKNSKMCIICGLDNKAGVQAPFYNMEDNSVASLFHFRQHHQSYPGRVHGGMITAMLDEMGLRALWAYHQGDESCFGVTISLESKFRKPVPYETDLIAIGTVTHESSRFFTVDARILDMSGNILASGIVNYIKMATEIISKDASIHEEMPYLIDDGVTELPIPVK